MRKKILAGVLAIACVFSVAACGGKTAENPTEEYKLTQVVNSFEDLDSYYSIATDGMFGTVSRNANADFVTEGEASLMLDVHGNAQVTSDKLCLSMGLTETGENLDMKKFKSLTFDIFNQTESKQTVEIAITVDGVRVGHTKTELETGKNTVRYAPDITGLRAACDFSKGETLDVTFARPAFGEDTNRFYIDNLTYNETIKEPAPLEMTLDKNEFCSFDKDWQAYVNGTEAVGPSADCLPTLAVNYDLKYCKGNTGRSLKVVCPTGTAPLSNGWPKITFLSALAEKFDWVSLKEKQAELVFDVYNPEYKAQSFEFSIWNEPTYSASNFATNTRPNYNMAFMAYHGWTEVRVPLKDIDNGVSETKQDLLSEHVRAVAIGYSKFADPDKTFYFDDFRFEIPAPEQGNE